MAINSTATVEIHGKPAPITNGYRLRKFAPTREERAEQLVANGLVHPTGELGEYFVESASAVFEGRRGEGYHVSTNRGTCQCPDFERNRNDALYLGCVHLLAGEHYRRIMRGSIRPQAAR